VIWLEMLLAGAVIAPLLRVALIVWPRAARLPDPSTVPGLPMAGPASPAAAHAAINRKKVSR
jgi:hypothetical protein